MTSRPTTCPHEGVDTRRTALRKEQNELELLSLSRQSRIGRSTGSSRHIGHIEGVDESRKEAAAHANS